MLTVSLRPHLEARLRVEAQKRGLKPEDFVAQIVQAVLEADRSVEEENAATAYLDEIRQSVNPKLLSERIRRDRNEDLAREEMKFERLSREGKCNANS